MAGEAGAVVGAVIAGTAYAAFAVVGVVLAVIDLREHRLPDRIVLPFLAGSAAALLIAGATAGDVGAWLRALAGALALGGFYFLLRMARPGGMGGGDVKLAAVIGLYLAWDGWTALAVGAFAAFAVGSLVALALLATRRASAGTRIAFGPWMLVGAWAGLVLA